MSYLIRLNGKKCRGWQARGGKHKGKYHSKMFSDSCFGGPDQAYQAALEYLKTLPPEETAPYPHGFYEGEQLLNNNKSGVNGVYRTHDYGKHDKRRRNYWAAFYTIDRNGQRGTRRHHRFYVDEWGEAEAKQRAVEFRQMWEAAAKQGVEAVQEFFNQYEMGWLA